MIFVFDFVAGSVYELSESDWELRMAEQVKAGVHVSVSPSIPPLRIRYEDEE